MIRRGSVGVTTPVRVQDCVQPAWTYPELRAHMDGLVPEQAPLTPSNDYAFNQQYQQQQYQQDFASQPAYTPGIMALLFCIYNWLSGILLCIVTLGALSLGPEALDMLGDKAELCIGLGLVEAVICIMLACLSRTRLRLALCIFTWMFFIFLPFALLELTTPEAESANALFSIFSTLLEIPFVCHYFIYRSSMPR